MFLFGFGNRGELARCHPVIVSKSLNAGKSASWCCGNVIGENHMLRVMIFHLIRRNHFQR